MNEVQNTAAPFSVGTPTHFRWRLQVTIMAVVSTVTLVVLFIAQKRLEQAEEQGLRREFQSTFEAMRKVQETRRAALMERCLGLAERLGTPSKAGEERYRLYAHGLEVLGDVLERDNGEEDPRHQEHDFHVEFFRFLDSAGRLIEPEAFVHTGNISLSELEKLRFASQGRSEPQFGTLIRDQSDQDGPLYDVIAMPVQLAWGQASTVTLLLGFEPATNSVRHMAGETLTGIWTGGQAFLVDLPPGELRQVAATITRALEQGIVPVQPLSLQLRGEPHLLLMQCLNVDSTFPPVYEFGVYSLAGLRELQWKLRWQVLSAGGLVLLLGLGASYLTAARFTLPVEQLMLSSAVNRVRRRNAEEALALTAEDLRRAARFSADASHQLKTPVAVLRAGLEELAAKERLSKSATREVQSLIAQSSRISGLIDDLLLLSRMDAGRLEIQFASIDLVRLIEGALDDRSVRPDPYRLRVETEMPAQLPVRGEARYLALLLENLVENAGKYNRPGGGIRIRAQRRGDWVELHIANTAAQPIPEAVRVRIFDRFHRGNMGEDVPGYGLGLNLARELARLHRGELELLRSDAEWTEFCVRLLPAEGN